MRKGGNISTEKGKGVEWNRENNVEQMCEQVKQAMVESAEV